MDSLLGFLFGVSCGMILITVIVSNAPSTIVYKAREALEICEQKLPRDQECKLTAVVVNE